MAKHRQKDNATKQLKDVVITISSVNYNDYNKPYAVTRVYRYDLVGEVESFISYVESTNQVVEGGQMRNMEVKRG